MKILFILLVILKIIGIILIVLIALILVLLLILLISPIRYELEGEKRKEFFGLAKISWIFGLVKIKLGLSPESEFEMKVKILWFTLLDSAAEPKPKKEPKLKRKVEAVKKPESTQKKIETSKAASKKIAEPLKKPMEEALEPPASKLSKEKPVVIAEKGMGSDVKMSIDTPQKQLEPQENDNVTVRRIKISDFVSENDEKTESSEIPEEATHTDEEINLEYFKNLTWQDKKRLIKSCTLLLKRLLKNIKPKDFFAELEFGTEDPALTGMLLGLAGTAKGILGESFYVRADFQRAYVEGSLRLKGRIVMMSVLIILARFVFVKQVFKIIKLYLKG